MAKYRMRYPSQPERNYTSLLMSMISEWKISISKHILPNLESIIKDYSFSTGRKIDSQWDTMMQNAIASLAIDMKESTKKAIINIPKYGRQIDDWHDREWKTAVKSVMGVDIVRFEPWQISFRQNFVNQNTELIKNLEADTLQNIRIVINNGIHDGMSVVNISRSLLAEASLKSVDGSSEIKKARNRAKLIAQDQVGSYNSRLNKQRQTEIGVYGYKWDNSGDKRVRGASNPDGLYKSSKYDHWARQDKKFLWEEKKNPPEGFSNPPKDGHPGAPIRCRCIGQPDFSTIGF